MHDLMNRPDDHEAKMARADLFKLAQYSFKLFKMIGENQELEGWVQAKITKAADYISSVYHYMQYEMKVSEYGDHLENAEMYSESIRRAFAQKLMEAKRMAAKAKADMKKKEKELDETVTPVAPGTTPEKAKLDPRYKTDPAFKREVDTAMKIKVSKKPMGKNPTPQHVDDPISPVKEAAKKGDGNLANNAKPYDKVTRGDVIAGRLGKDEKGGKKVKEGFDDLEKATKERGEKEKKEKGTGKFDVKKTSTGTQYTRKASTFDDGGKDKDLKKAEKKAEKKVKETATKCNHSPKGKSCPVHGLKECGTMEGMSHQAKTTMKHIKNPTPGEKKAAKDIRPGVKGGYSDRAAMLRSAEQRGAVKDD